MDYCEKLIKRLFDSILAFIFLVLLIAPILILILIATFDCAAFGLFQQIRIGRKGMPFRIFKIRTMGPSGEISKFGKFLRRSKLDELPQLLNILIGKMSFVGPRPDLPGYLDKLEGKDRMLLEYKPGLTSPASLLYFNEDELLEGENNPKEYYDTIIWPKKVTINKRYFEKYSFKKDLILIVNTLWYAFFKKELFSFSEY